MPRTGRKHSATGIYHVMLRGINRQDIFEEPEDYWEFIRILFLLYNTFFLKDGGTPKVACLFFLISIAIFFSFIGRWTLDALVNYNIPQLCMPAVPRRAVRTVTTKRMISVQVFFFMVIEEPTPAPPKGREPCHSSEDRSCPHGTGYAPQP